MLNKNNILEDVSMQQEVTANVHVFAGVDIDKTKIIVYGISGFMSALSGLILLSRLNSAQPTLGDGYEMDAIAATALGGTSMSGGRGKIQGTLIGVLIIAVLNNGMNISWYFFLLSGRSKRYRHSDRSTF